MGAALGCLIPIALWLSPTGDDPSGSTRGQVVLKLVVGSLFFGGIGWGLADRGNYLPKTLFALLGGLAAAAIWLTQGLDASSPTHMNASGVVLFAMLGAFTGSFYQGKLAVPGSAALRGYVRSRLFGEFERPASLPADAPVPHGVWVGSRVSRDQRRYARHTREARSIWGGLAISLMGCILVAVSLPCAIAGGMMIFSPGEMGARGVAYGVLAIPCSLLLALGGIVVVRIGYGVLSAYRTLMVDFDQGDVHAWDWCLGSYKGLQQASLRDVEKVAVVQREETELATSGPEKDTFRRVVYYDVALVSPSHTLVTVDSFGRWKLRAAQKLAQEMADVLQKPLETELLEV